MKTGKRSILQKMLYLHFIVMTVRHPFSAPAPENTPILRETQYNYIRFDSQKPTIPIFSPSRRVYPPGRSPVFPYGTESSRRPEPMIALKLHCVPIIPSFHHSLRGVGATLQAGGQLRSEAELSSKSLLLVGSHVIKINHQISDNFTAGYRFDLDLRIRLHRRRAAFD